MIEHIVIRYTNDNDRYVLRGCQVIPTSHVGLRSYFQNFLVDCGCELINVFYCQFNFGWLNLFLIHAKTT